MHEVGATILPENTAESTESGTRGLHRWALTVWLRAKDLEAIKARNPATDDLHFGTGAFARIQAQAQEPENADAHFALGECFAYGRGVEEDPATAATWFRLAAEAGHAKAAHKLKPMAQ